MKRRDKMIYNIENKEIKASFRDEIIELPHELKEKIKKNFVSIVMTGVKVWNGEVLCVSKCDIKDEILEIVCNKSDYAHYLYGEKIGLPKEYECRNLSAGCLVETIDGYYLIGELDDNTSYPNVLQVTGGNIDKKDVIGEKILVEKTISREAKEELNIDLKDSRINYMYITEENEQPGIQIFSKAIINMTAEDINNHFQKYYKYLKENNLEIEFKKLHFLKKEKAIESLGKLDNPKRNYLIPLIQLDLKSIKLCNEEE